MKRSVLVTGAGKGLGFEVARQHLIAGDTVYALEHQITDALTALQTQFAPLLTVRQCDLRHTQEVNAAMQTLRENSTPLDIIYNIAGIFFESDRVPLEETDLERCILMYEVNAMGTLRVMAAAVPLLHKGSIVINVTSESGSVTDCHRTSEYGYGMSKAACNMASKIFANQMQPHGVRVFCYHPGWMKTDMGGEGARLSDSALTPQQAADALMDITLHPQAIPDDVMYLDYNKTPLRW